MEAFRVDILTGTEGKRIAIVTNHWIRDRNNRRNEGQVVKGGQADYLGRSSEHLEYTQMGMADHRMGRFQA